MSVLTPGKKAPDFALLGTDGLPRNLDDAGGPVLAVFFKTTCPTCMTAFPYVERMHQTYGQKGLTVWGISQDPLDDSLAFAREWGAMFPILLDSTWDVSNAYGLDTVPTLFLIEGGNSIAFTSVSFYKDEINQIARLVAERLRTDPVVIAPPDDGKPAFKPG